VSEVTVLATFPDGASARRAARGLGALRATVGEPGAGRHEAGFMRRFVIIVVFWSIVGTGLGAALGALLSYTVGPHGREGLILHVVTWAIFAHLIIGMWAGYFLLADRSGRELAGAEATLTAVAERPLVAALAERLREAGAISVRVLPDVPVAGTGL
jgi:hypothetical protein